MGRRLLAIAVCFVIFFVVPFPFYAGLAALTGLEPPEGASPAVFMLSVTVQKLGHAVVFVLLFEAVRSVFQTRPMRYAAYWWVLFVINEVGMAIGPEYSWTEAAAGVLAESIYFPLAALVTSRLLRPTPNAEASAAAGA